MTHDDLTKYLTEAEAMHKATGNGPQDWAAWYAGYILDHHPWLQHVNAPEHNVM